MLQDSLPSWQRLDMPLWVIQMPWEQLQLTVKSNQSVFEMLKRLLKLHNFNGQNWY
jgi:hypothetical protein